MARPRQRSLVTQLADAGEEAIKRLGDAPGADRVLGAMNSALDRMDEMQRKMRGFDTIEKRLGALERRLDKLEGKGTTKRKRSSTTTRRSSASAAKKSSSSS